VKIPGGVPYSSEDKHVGISVEYPVEGAIEALIDQALAQETVLDAAIKIQLAAQLGIDLVEIKEGVFRPKWTDVTVPEKPKAQRAASSGGGGRSGGGGGGDRKPPKVDPDRIPTFYDPETQQKVQDLRPFKGKEYAANSADFRRNGESIWVIERDGSVNEEGARLEELADSR
jgi:hypothetical protein